MSQKRELNKWVNFESLYNNFESYAHLSHGVEQIVPVAGSVAVYESKRNRRVLMQFTEEKIVQSDHKLRAQAVAFNNRIKEECTSWSGSVLGFRNREDKGSAYNPVGESGMSPILGSVYIKQGRIVFDDQWLPEIGSEIQLFSPAVINELPTTAIYQPPRSILSTLLRR